MTPTLPEDTFPPRYHQNTATFKVAELHVSVTCQLTRSVTTYAYAGKSMQKYRGLYNNLIHW